MTVHEPKSSESALPHHSSGDRDDLIQHQYLRAMHLYWRDPARNPVSEHYGGPMVDMDRAFVWAWDARPYPWFPGRSDLWSDGANWQRGHWITGRVSGRTLASVVAEICAGAGLTAIDTSALHGFVRGYAVTETGDARRALQPLMLAYGFDAIERDGLLVFRMRDGTDAAPLDPGEFAEAEGLEAAFQVTREAEAAMAGRLRLRFYEADADHEPAAEETVAAEDATHAVAESEIALSFSRAEARRILERWLAEAEVARETLRLALPPSRLDLGPGDVVEFPDGAGRLRARIDRVEITDRQLIEAVRIEPSVYTPAQFPDDPAPLKRFAPPLPVLPLFLDLPLITGDEVPHAPHIALSAEPWPGSAAVYDSAEGADYALNTVIGARSVIGLTETPLPFARPGLIDRGAPLAVRLIAGAFASISDGELLAGGNLLAIGDGSPGGWEILQFRDAQLVEQGLWWLGHRLRGRFGTDAAMPEVWPAGSYVVRLDGAPRQIALAQEARRHLRHYRVGPARRPYDDPSYVDRVWAFEGLGLRPYAPVHLTARAEPGGQRLRWVRRTRIDGNDWDLPEVPLGEESERYLVRVQRGATVLRETSVAAAEWLYPAAALSADTASGAVEVRVAQVSARFGPGPASVLTLP
ncbi:phage tail protein [Roseivivax sp. CAU 1761]